MAAIARAEEGTLSVQVRSAYVTPKGIVYDGPVAQSELIIPLPEIPCYVDAWWSVSLDNLDPSGDWGDEMDYTLGCMSPLWRLTFDAGVTYVDFAELGRSRGGDAVIAYGELGYPLLGRILSFTPFVRGEQHWMRDWRGLPAGLRAESGVQLYGGYKMYAKFLSGAVGGAGIGVSQRLAVMYDSGTYVGFGRGFVSVYSLGGDVMAGDRVTVNAVSAYVLLPLQFQDGRRPAMALSTGITVAF